jgi:hypothetical protein
MVLSVRRLGAVATMAAALAHVVVATSCTDSELTDTETAYTDYGTTLDTDCSPDPCSSECVATMSTLAEHLPDCEYSDGINYYDGLLVSVDLCAQDASGSTWNTVLSSSSLSSEFGSESGTDATCSESELSDMDAYVANYTDIMMGSCNPDSCASACITDLTALAAVLPDCEYSDGLNYYDGVSTQIEVCSDSLGASGSVGSSAGECSTSDSADIEQYLATYDAQFTSECSTDECSSGCLTLLAELVGVLPDCTDADGVNYYEDVQIMIDECGSSSASASSASSATGSSTSGSASSGSGSSSSLFSASSTASDASAAADGGSSAASTSAAATAALSTALALVATSLVL